MRPRSIAVGSASGCSCGSGCWVSGISISARNLEAAGLRPLFAGAGFAGSGCDSGISSTSGTAFLGRPRTPFVFAGGGGVGATDSSIISPTSFIAAALRPLVAFDAGAWFPDFSARTARPSSEFSTAAASLSLVRRPDDDVVFAAGLVTLFAAGAVFAAAPPRAAFFAAGILLSGALAVAAVTAVVRIPSCDANSSSLSESTSSSRLDCVFGIELAILDHSAACRDRLS